MPPNPRRRAPSFGELRPSQIITTFGPGSVVDLQNASVVIGGTDLWTIGKDQEIDEPRLKSLLRVNRLYRPAVKSDSGASGVPSFLFPRYLRCPRCRRIGQYDRSDLFYLDRKKFRCKGKHEGKVPRGGPVVFPARFVVACADGHLDDFPWFSYVHRGKDAALCRPELLVFRESAQSAAIAELVVSCDNCGARRSMESAFGKRAKKALGMCSGATPWLGVGTQQVCGSSSVRTMLRGASNLYFSVVQSALSIPEWDDPIHAAIASYEDQLTKIDSIDTLALVLKAGVFPALEQFPPERILLALKRRREQAALRPTAQQLRYEEFKALSLGASIENSLVHEFETEVVDVPLSYASKIARVVIVRRLREVRAVAGFTRIDIPYELLLHEEEQTDKYRIQALSGSNLPWRPAVELRGEGIFVEFSEEAVAEWESQAVKVRARDMTAAHRRWRAERQLPEAPYPGSRFVLLHTFAHMLIQGLALDCGYSSTSIRERVYSSSDPETRMAGVLLYTATPDSDGSLGGLAEKGRPKHLGTLIEDALERARYCSSDPLCGHSAPGELGHLNGAACHACLLVSETSCERGNRYLDRAHVVETVAQLGTSYF
jgi:hypothetical protein